MRRSIKTLVLPAILATLTLSVPVHAQTINLLIQAEEILQGGSGSQPAAANSLVLLVADTTGAGFKPLTSGCITTGSEFGPKDNDLIIDQLSIVQGNFLFNNEPVLDSAINNISFFGAWDANDPLAIYWLPSLTTGASNVGLSVAYGMYTDQVGVDGSAAWITPATGQGAPMFFTTDGHGIGIGSSVPVSTGFSSLSTVAVPEPADFGLLGGASALGLVLLRRRKRVA
jgi:hypothetical protein